IETVSELLANLVLGSDGVAAFSAGAGRNTDDNGLLEYSAPRRLLSNPDEAALLLALENMRTSELDAADASAAQLRETHPARRARGAAIRASLFLSSGETARGIDALREAAQANPADAFLERTLAANQRHADEQAAAGQIDQAIARYRMLLDVAPDRPATKEGLEKLLASVGR
ncbi:MAG: hypothetical protein GTO30_13950, partial [Acidobacteria bacterium]|nr:hypothetical protein [Acidobacteriota bacterium]NIQ85744.1 hypothetical protein [Acidobacteriota bacterium]